MKFFLWLLLFMLTLKTSAQHAFTKDLDPFIKKEFKQIRKSGADTILIYEEYCIGCEVKQVVKQTSKAGLVPCLYKGFIRGKIFWKLHNKYYAKEITCSNDDKIIETNGEIFAYFFLHMNCFKSIYKYQFTGKFFPPVPVHSSYEDLRLYTPKVMHEICLAEQQKEDPNWKTYEWIPPAIAIMKIVESTFFH